jgi:hypothetical protein
MMGCQMPGIPSGVWHHIEVVVQTLHLGAETHHERIAMGIYDFFIGMFSSCT